MPSVRGSDCGCTSGCLPSSHRPSCRRLAQPADRGRRGPQPRPLPAPHARGRTGAVRPDLPCRRRRRPGRQCRGAVRYTDQFEPITLLSALSAVTSRIGSCPRSTPPARRPTTLRGRWPRQGQRPLFPPRGLPADQPQGTVLQGARAAEHAPLAAGPPGDLPGRRLRAGKQLARTTDAVFTAAQTVPKGRIEYRGSTLRDHLGPARPASHEGFSHAKPDTVETGRSARA